MTMDSTSWTSMTETFDMRPQTIGTKLEQLYVDTTKLNMFGLKQFDVEWEELTTSHVPFPCYSAFWGIFIQMGVDMILVNSHT